MSCYGLTELLHLRVSADVETLKFHQNARIYKLISEKHASRFEFYETAEHERSIHANKSDMKQPKATRIPQSLHPWASAPRSEPQSMPIALRKLMQAEAEQLIKSLKLQAGPTRMSLAEDDVNTIDMSSQLRPGLLDEPEEQDKTSPRSKSRGTRDAPCTRERYRDHQNTFKVAAPIQRFDSSLTIELSSSSETSILDLNSCIKTIRTCGSAVSTLGGLCIGTSELTARTEEEEEDDLLYFDHSDLDASSFQCQLSYRTSQNLEDESIRSANRDNRSGVSSQPSNVAARPLRDHQPVWGVRPERCLEWKDTSPRPVRSRRCQSFTSETQVMQHKWKDEEHETTWNDIKTEVDGRATLFRSWLESLPVEVAASVPNSTIEIRHDICRPVLFGTRENKHQGQDVQDVLSNGRTEKEVSTILECDDAASFQARYPGPFQKRYLDMKKELDEQAASAPEILAGTSDSDSSADQIE